MPNLLINGDFQINQRGQTVYETNTEVIYSVDMWRIYQIKLEVLNDGIKITGKSASDTGYLTQTLDIDGVNKEYTMVAKVDGNIQTFTVTLSDIAKEKTFDKFKFNIRSISDRSKIEVNICPLGTNSIVVNYVRLYDGDIAYKGQKEDYVTALMRCLPYSEYGEFAVQYNNTTYFISGFTYKFPKKDKPNIIFIKTVVDENGNVSGTFEAVAQNACSCPFIKYNGKSAVGLGNKTLNVRVLITCEPLP